MIYLLAALTVLLFAVALIIVKDQFHLTINSVKFEPAGSKRNMVQVVSVTFRFGTKAVFYRSQDNGIPKWWRRVDSIRCGERLSAILENALASYTFKGVPTKSGRYFR